MKTLGWLLAGAAAHRTLNRAILQLAPDALVLRGLERVALTRMGRVDETNRRTWTSLMAHVRQLRRDLGDIPSTSG